MFFTICSNNYLAQAKVLAASLKKFESSSAFIIFLCDKKNAAVSYENIADEIIAIEEIEPEINSLALRYNIIELNTCVKPRIFKYLFNERKISKAVYLDPDIKLFSSISFLFDEPEASSILLTPHVYSPIPHDGKKPSDNTFLAYGLYNLGFLALKNNETTKHFLSWWKEHTYTQGYFDKGKGIFVDQLPVNLVPIFFSSVKVLQDKGLNMAPWNLHERYLSCKDNNYFVNENELLKFYHFSSFKADLIELPLQHYDRFTLSERKDLQKLYEDYNEELKIAGYFFYSEVKSAYSLMHKEFSKRKKRKKISVNNFFKKIFYSKK